MADLLNDLDGWNYLLLQRGWRVKVNKGISHYHMSEGKPPAIGMMGTIIDLYIDEQYVPISVLFDGDDKSRIVADWCFDVLDENGEVMPHRHHTPLENLYDATTRWRGYDPDFKKDERTWETYHPHLKDWYIPHIVHLKNKITCNLIKKGITRGEIAKYIAEVEPPAPTFASLREFYLGW